MLKKILTKFKGVIETLKAFEKLAPKYPNLIYFAVNSVNPQNIDSSSISEEFHRLISQSDYSDRVFHIDQFISHEEVLAFMQMADISVFAYKDNGETTSGAIRSSITAQLPIIATRTRQFENMGDNLFYIDNLDSDDIAMAIEKLIVDKQLYNKLSSQIKTIYNKQTVDRLSYKYLESII